MTRSLWIVLLVFTAACGRGDSVERMPEPEASTSGVLIDAPLSSAKSVAAVPEFLSTACVAGDPGEGVAWSLDSVALPAMPSVAIETLSPRDSAALAARVARMVDVLPSDTAVADFSGLPVMVRSAWRLVPAEGDTIVIVLAARRIPIESAPLEERFTILAAPGTRSGVRDPLVEGWFSRDAGPEESLDSREFTGAFMLADAIAIAFLEDTDAGVRLAIVTRRAGRWAVQWTGARSVCRAPDGR